MIGILTDVAMFFFFKTLDLTIALLIVVLILILERVCDRLVVKRS